MGRRNSAGKITPLGTNFVELKTPVKKLAEAAIQGSIINSQTNYNHGSAVKIRGDQNNAIAAPLIGQIAPVEFAALGI